MAARTRPHVSSSYTAPLLSPSALTIHTPSNLAPLYAHNMGSESMPNAVTSELSSTPATDSNGTRVADRSEAPSKGKNTNARVRMATLADLDELVEIATRSFLDNALYHYVADAHVVRLRLSTASPADQSAFRPAVRGTQTDQAASYPRAVPEIHYQERLPE